MMDVRPFKSVKFNETSEFKLRSAHKAAFGLKVKYPWASAGLQFLPPVNMWLAPIVFVLGLSVYMPQIIGLTGLACVYIFCLSISLVRVCAASLRAQYAPFISLNDNDLPTITVLVALYDEAQSVKGLMRSLSRFDYPTDKLDIIIILEAHDHETICAARRAINDKMGRVLIIPRSKGPMTKPRALNYALEFTRCELVAVYDAEDAPHPGQLRAASQAFAANHHLGVVQAPLGWYNRSTNWLTRQFALEYASQFEVLLPFYSKLALPLPLGGTSNVFRRHVLEETGGWDAFNVTEDADLGFRLARFGWQAGLIAPGTLEEAPETLSSWTGQRSRWLKGHLITWLVQMREPPSLARGNGWKNLIALKITLLANIMGACAFIPGLILLGLGVIAALTGKAGLLIGLGLAIGVLSLGAAMVCAFVGARRALLNPRIVDIVSLPLYWALQGPALIRALRELIKAPYVWVKTDHGLSTTKRQAPHVFKFDPDIYDHQCRPVYTGGLAQQPTQQSAQTAPHSLDAHRDHKRVYSSDPA